MPDGLTEALAIPGLTVIAIAYLIAGIVRGFTGFGSALIVVPIAGIYLNPGDILFLITMTGVLSNAYLLPRAWSEADRGEVGWLVIGAIPGVLLGFFFLTLVDPTALRWMVALIGATTLLAIISGWQWRTRLKPPGLSVIGATAGTVGGMTALTGPIAIMFYLANARQAKSVRANMILFLAALDLLIIINIFALGTWSDEIVWLCLVFSLPYLSMVVIGQALFDPARGDLYRAVAYGIVAMAILTGLPIWST